MSRTSTVDLKARPTQHVIPKRGQSAAAPTEKGVRKYIDTSTYEGAAQIDPDKPLTAQQLAFAHAWASGESTASAALRAGYSDEAIGYRLIRMPNVRRAYDIEKAKYEEACQMSRKKVMDMLIESFDMAKLMAEPAAMVSAAREIGKMCGYYEPVRIKMDMTVNGEVAVRQLNAMSDAELLKLITGGVQATPALPTPDPLNTTQG
jgi:phage terminase small subunit